MKKTKVFNSNPFLYYIFSANKENPEKKKEEISSIYEATKTTYIKQSREDSGSLSVQSMPANFLVGRVSNLFPEVTTDICRDFKARLGRESVCV